MFALDDNEDGNLNNDELKELLRYTGQAPTDTCAACLLALADRNGDSVLDSGEYAMYSKKPDLQDDTIEAEAATKLDENVNTQLKGSFHAMDTNSDGKVSEVEVDNARSTIATQAGVADAGNSNAMASSADIIKEICADQTCEGEAGKEFSEEDYVNHMSQQLQS